MNHQDFIKQILTDIKIKLTDEFDKNFERKGFFNKKWSQPKLRNRRGSLMSRSGALRRSIQSKVSDRGVTFSSSLPYAQIQNDGGKIKVTKKMISFFWAMYYKASGAVGKQKNDRNKLLTAEALMWKAMALKKVGSYITIQQRQFIGHHPKVDRMIRSIIHQNLQELNHKIAQKHGNNN